MPAFIPHAPVGDITVTTSSVTRAFPIYTTAVRFVPDEDIYVAFGTDNTVTASIGGSNCWKVKGGSVESFQLIYPQWTHYAVIAAVAGQCNVCGGSEN